jgi:hypothetical protein
VVGSFPIAIISTRPAPQHSALLWFGVPLAVFVTGARRLREEMPIGKMQIAMPSTSRLVSGNTEAKAVITYY